MIRWSALRGRAKLAYVLLLDRSADRPPLERLLREIGFEIESLEDLPRSSGAREGGPRGTPASDRCEHRIESDSESLESLQDRLGIVGRSGALRELLLTIRKVAPFDPPVLLEGETGVGKERFAEAIHRLSARRERPFVVVNCGGLASDLVEAELFGFVEGAFTGAGRARRGLISTANHGTLFLDEIEAMSPRTQSALLRALESARVRPVGSDREMPIDVRWIAATNVPLTDLAENGAFRTDLLYRLDVIHLRVPPLRERKDDIEPLALHFAAKFAAEFGLQSRSFAEGELARLALNPLHGNVRELQNLVLRAVLLSAGSRLRLDASPGADQRLSISGPANKGTVLEALPLREAKARAAAEVEQSYLTAALEAAEGNVTRAARLVGKERRAFGRLMKKHGIVARSARSRS